MKQEWADQTTAFRVTFLVKKITLFVSLQNKLLNRMFMRKILGIFYCN